MVNLLEYEAFMKTINIEELVQFSQQHRWKPHYPTSLVRRFLTELISSQSLILDLHDQDGRISAAVLLDKVNNPERDACLEILGMRPGENNAIIIAQFIEFAKKQTPPKFSGFQIGLHDSFMLADFVKQQGLQHNYDTYEMLLSNLSDIQSVSQKEIVDASYEDGPEIYEVLCDSFKQNPDTSIPVENDWIAGFLRSPKSHFYIWRDGGKILGFANLVEEENGQETEVRTIGVLPECRGKSLGRHLLQHCLSQSFQLGYNKCRLTVAVKNEAALGLYLKAGFMTVDKYSCYRMELRGYES
jgi:ribosomal protein S18 acetylase RimI-like enzyme